MSNSTLALENVIDKVKSNLQHTMVGQSKSGIMDKFEEHVEPNNSTIEEDLLILDLQVRGKEHVFGEDASQLQVRTAFGGSG